MNFLLIGGSGFIGSHIASGLQKIGHNVTVFHRGNTALHADVEQWIGDRNRLREYRDHFRRRKFDVVIDLILSSEDQARQTVETFRGIARRVVALSSIDVYRAWGVFYGFEPGGLQEMPVTEDSQLRSNPIAYPPEMHKKFRELFSWASDDYDKVRVERVVLNDPELPGTVLRLPMVYGPGDRLHRLHFLLKRMDDGRRSIIFAGDVAAFRAPRGYVEDVAHGIALAATSDHSAGRVYNDCDLEASTELEWARKVAAVVGWQGNFVVLPPDQTPKHLLMPGNTAQHLVASSDRIRQELGYCELLPQEEAIRRTIVWEREHPPQNPVAVFDYAAEDKVEAAILHRQKTGS